jgi:hypothetical protein
MNDSKAGTSGAVTDDFDVFLNQRGPDVKATFVAHLEEALRRVSSVSGRSVPDEGQPRARIHRPGSGHGQSSRRGCVERVCGVEILPELAGGHDEELQTGGPRVLRRGAEESAVGGERAFRRGVRETQVEAENPAEVARVERCTWSAGRGDRWEWVALARLLLQRRSTITLWLRRSSGA